MGPALLARKCPPLLVPFTAATSTFGNRSISIMNRPGAASTVRAPPDPEDNRTSASLRSAPLLKYDPAPVKTAAETEASIAASRSAEVRSSYVARNRAFRTRGRSMVMRRTEPRRPRWARRMAPLPWEATACQEVGGGSGGGGACAIAGGFSGGGSPCDGISSSGRRPRSRLRCCLFVKNEGETSAGRRRREESGERRG